MENYFEAAKVALSTRGKYWAPSGVLIQAREADHPQIGVSGHNNLPLPEGGDFTAAAATAFTDDDTRPSQPSFVGSGSEESATSGTTETNGIFAIGDINPSYPKTKSPGQSSSAPSKIPAIPRSFRETLASADRTCWIGGHQTGASELQDKRNVEKSEKAKKRFSVKSNVDVRNQV
ncbi:uncharacterized protein SAPINGB_P005524 [Magnusiomyces paraingens]|uniref:Uncharacterized protein n=1 Tax=Magnusiomyces paraingens TaxID=2606893 RepID=A0A5E8C275_9ASCO|nr:uncharacterized protein SAPINGB_P005524 [Saprochaete ingens]VVT57080.1 unnamed protein product [Saprochaete ingens]